MDNKEQNEFKNYQLSSDILETLGMLNYVKPTQIQNRVIPLVLEGKSIAAKSQTGTGKTAAFAIPICELVQWEGNTPQALILEPTRELTVQVRNEIFHIGRKKRLKVPAVFGGFPIDKQMQSLKQKSHIVVGTPGRVMDHIRRGSMKLDQIKYIVLDEADLMLDMGFYEDVKQIIEAIPYVSQMLLFSATLNSGIQNLVKEYMTDAVSVIMESKSDMVSGMEQAVYEIGQDDKYNAFLNILIQENPEYCMVFCATREMVNTLCHKMRRDKISCGMIHGELDQGERLKMIESFRMGRYHYLIATDIAARGVDFENITHVINYDFPTGKETFIHRAGRTARNGKSGKVISLVTENDKKMMLIVEDYIGQKLPKYDSPIRQTSDEENFWRRQNEKAIPKARPGDVFKRTIMRLSIGGGKKSKMRAVDIVGTICSIEGMTADDIGIIDVRDSLTYVEILNGKGTNVLTILQSKPIKGKIRKVRVTRG